jgi:hypothetical protein
MGEISSTGFKYLSLHKKLDLELEKNIKKIDREVLRRRHSLFTETENVRRELDEMFKAAQDIDSIFGPEFTEEVARKLFPSKRRRSKDDDGVDKTTSYILTRARNAMKELKKSKKREKVLQNRKNHIRRKSFAKRLSTVKQDDDKNLQMMLESIKNLTLFGKNSDMNDTSLPKIKGSDSEDADDKQPRLGASKSKLSSQRWKDLKMARELSLPIINRKHDKANNVPASARTNDVIDKPNERLSEKERPKMPPRNSFDLSTLPAISLAKQTIASGEPPSKSEQNKDDEKCKDSEQKESNFIISKYLSEVHENLPKETLLEIERMMKEESFIL